MDDLHRIDFADAYLGASAERSGVGQIVSFDRAIKASGRSDVSSPRSPAARSVPSLVSSSRSEPTEAGRSPRNNRTQSEPAGRLPRFRYAVPLHHDPSAALDQFRAVERKGTSSRFSHRRGHALR